MHLFIWVASTTLDGVLTSFIASDAAQPGDPSIGTWDDGGDQAGYTQFLNLEEALVALLWLLV